MSKLTQSEIIKKISELLEDNDDILGSELRSIRGDINNLKFWDYLRDLGFGIRPSSIVSKEFSSLTSEIYIGMFGEKYNRLISWSDDDRQPDDELLMKVSFSTGPYFFGKDYPAELFKEFFEKLKEYSPKYVDTTNSSLYFPVGKEHPKTVTLYNEFYGIVEEFRKQYSAEENKRKIEAMELELKKLKGEV